MLTLRHIRLLLTVAVLLGGGITVGAAAAELPDRWSHLTDLAIDPSLEPLLQGIDPLVSQAWFQKSGDTLRVLAIGTATIPAADDRTWAENNASEGARTVALAEIVRLLEGVAVEANAKIREGTTITTTSSETVFEEFVESRSEISTATQGVARGARTIGSWLSSDRRTMGVLLFAEPTQRIEPAASSRTRDDKFGDYVYSYGDLLVVRTSGSGHTPEAAREDALRAALTRALGVAVMSVTLVLETETHLNRVRSCTRGYIQDYRVLEGPSCHGNHCTVEVKAWISTAALKADVRRLSAVVGNPTLVVIDVSPHRAHGGGHSLADYAKASLIDLGFTVRECDAALSDALRTLPDGEMVARLGRRDPAVDIALLVSAECSPPTTTDMSMCQCMVRAKALDVRTRQLLGVAEEVGRGRSLVSVNASELAALKEGAQAAVQRFSTQIVADWERQAADGHLYRIRVVNESGARFGNELITALRQTLERCPGGRSVEEKFVDSGVMELELVHDGLIGEVRTCLMAGIRRETVLSELTIRRLGGSLVELGCVACR